MAVQTPFQLFYCFLAVGVFTPSLLMSSHTSSKSKAVLGNSTNATNITSPTIAPTMSNGSTPTNQSVTPAAFSSPATPILKYGHFNLSQNGTVCLYAYMECGVTYRANSSVPVKEVYNVPDSAKVSGQCAMGVNMNGSFILLDWSEQSTKLTLKLRFMKLADSSWSVSNIVVTILVKNVAIMASKNQSDVFHAPVGSYYKCSTSEKVVLSDGVTVDFKQVKLQPFPSKKGEIGTAKECATGGKPDNSLESNIVPIAVGCVLGGLIIILLITYVVGRTKKRGYEQM